jgi:hypothetical protein
MTGDVGMVTCPSPSLLLQLPVADAPDAILSNDEPGQGHMPAMTTPPETHPSARTPRKPLQKMLPPPGALVRHDPPYLRIIIALDQLPNVLLVHRQTSPERQAIQDGRTQRLQMLV